MHSFMSTLAMVVAAVSCVQAIPMGSLRRSSNEIKARNTWKPAAGASWQIILSGTPTKSDMNLNVDVFDIDLFDNDASTIKALQSQGKKVICYFSAGSYEAWRPDADKFKNDDFGGGLVGWQDEMWLRVSSPNVHTIMEARLDMAVQKGCDAVDPDNVDGYSNKENNLGLTAQDAVDYVTFLSEAAHSRGLSIGLKNAGSIIDQVKDKVEFSVNEQCLQYNECAKYSPFITAGKPVFHIEYPKGDDANNNQAVSASKKNGICQSSTSDRFSTLIKNMNLDAWFQAC